ncbi:uroporphyrinogen-III synthase [Cryptotrichosporon argae]
MARTPTVVLFRSPSGRDPYAILGRHYTIHTVPVLVDVFDVGALQAHLGPAGAAAGSSSRGRTVPGVASTDSGFEGVIMTSKRAAEAWTCGVDEHGSSVDWSTTPLFSPGEAARAVLAPLPTSLRPALDTHRPAKSAAALAPIILARPSRAARCARLPATDHYHAHAGAATRQSCECGAATEQDGVGDRGGDGNQGEREAYRPYLFLTGDKTLRDLPDALRAARRSVVEVQVYATAVRADMGGALARVRGDVYGERATGLSVGASVGVGTDAGTGEGEGWDGDGRAARSGAPDAQPVWAAFFSPSSAAGVVPHLTNWPALRIAAVGETTAAYLRSALGGHAGLPGNVDAVADTPGAEGLLDAILAADGRAGERPALTEPERA